MAAAIHDFPTDSRFHSHTMIAGNGSSQQPSPVDSTYRKRSRSQKSPPNSHPQPTDAPTEPSLCNIESKQEGGVDTARRKEAAENLPSPPLTSSPKGEEVIGRTDTGVQDINVSTTPSRESLPRLREPAGTAQAQSSSANYAATPRPACQSSNGVRNSGSTDNTVKVRDLAHIRTLASSILSTHDDLSPSTSFDPESLPSTASSYEISTMPITDIIEMVAGLLTKITTTNDLQHTDLHRATHAFPSESPSLPGLSSSVLAFHGKNVPSITILSYLSRIHKYCPTTYEVFLSLLVFFDRMAGRVNGDVLGSSKNDVSSVECLMNDGDTASMNTDPERYETGLEVDDSDLADSPPLATSHPDEVEAEGSIHVSVDGAKNDVDETEGKDTINVFPFSHFFVVDSFNIHRLVIAGVTCASKYFSDVFYTNSRYAKVGGLPLPELNYLELQFLLLNDFRLSVSVEELESYGTMLVEFYAREVGAMEEAGG